MIGYLALNIQRVNQGYIEIPTTADSTFGLLIILLTAIGLWFSVNTIPHNR